MDRCDNCGKCIEDHVDGCYGDETCRQHRQTVAAPRIVSALEARPHAWQADAQSLLGASREPHSAADYLAAVRAACLDMWDVDTGTDGADCILSTVSASHALADVAGTYEAMAAATPEERAAWARRRGWTATRIGSAS